MTQLTYTPQSLVIQTNHGPRRISAQLASNGLAYHPTIEHGEACEVYLNVTHGASGYALCSFLTTEEQCRTCIRLVDRLCDWRKPRETIHPQRELFSCVRAIVRHLRKQQKIGRQLREVL